MFVCFAEQVHSGPLAPDVTLQLSNQQTGLCSIILNHQSLLIL